MKKTKKIINKTFAILFAMICLLTTNIQPAYAFETPDATVKGRLTNSLSTTKPCGVATNGRSAKLRICTFNQAGARTSGKLWVKVIADNGWEKTYSITGCNGWSNRSTNLSLPSGYTHYRIYPYRRGTKNSNLRKTFYCSIDFMNNCWRAWY